MVYLYDDTWKQVPCNSFKGKLDKGGYGRTSSPKHGTYRAHTIAYIDYYGPIVLNVKRPMVLHKCDNPSCIEPLHLFIGTQTDNMLDMVTKGRSLHRHGASNPNAKLSWEQVTAIRASSKTVEELAVNYDVTKTSIRFIIKYKTWKR